MLPFPTSRSQIVSSVVRLAAVLIVAFLLVGLAVKHAASADASPAMLTLPLAGIVPPEEQPRLERTLRREGLVLLDDARRKGQMVIVTGLQRQVPWRLVIDARSGDIVGRRPLSD